MISVIVPVYKVQDYLDECIESVVNQTYRDLEIILVDDGSPDRCPQMCDEWAKKDGRIRVIHKKNGGLSDARNVGLDKAKGEYIAFVDSDDWVELDCFEKLYEVLHQHPDCAISSCSLWIYTDGRKEPHGQWDFKETKFVEPEEYADKMLLMESQHTACCKLYKREVFRDIRYRKGHNNEDILFALDFYPIVEKHRYRIVEIPDKLLYYRQHEGSICHNRESPFFITEAMNRGVVLRAVKGKKPNVYEEYKKRYIHDVALLLSYKLNYPDKYNFGYYSLCKDLWSFSDSYARKELSDSEYATYRHCKYLAPLMWLKYAIKR